MRQSTIINILLAVIALVLALAVVWFVQKQLLPQAADPTGENTEATPDIEPDAFALYDADSDDTKYRLFQTAESALVRGDYGTARDLLEKVLTDNPDLTPEERAHIEYKIALTYTTTDQVKTVALMQDLVSNSDYPDQQKAYAVQHMYTVWRFFSVNNYDEVKNQIFSGNYATFLVPTSTKRSMVNLNQNALSYGTAPFSEIEIAVYESSRLLKDDLSEEEREELLDTIELRLVSVQDYMDRNEGFAPNASLEPRIRQGVANTFGNLVQAGESEYVEAMDDSYQFALQVEDTTSQLVIMSIMYAYAASFTDNEAVNVRAQAALTGNVLIGEENYPGVVTWLLKHKDPTVDDTFIRTLSESNTEFGAMLGRIGYF